MIGEGTAVRWWDLAVEIAARRAFVTGFKHRVLWDQGAGVWRVTLSYPSRRIA